MIIGGLEKFSLLDYPGYISAIVFTQGCNFRCHFCYNPMLVWPVKGNGKLNIEEDHPLILEDDLFRFLKSRIGKLEAVVITGGEPTMHSDLDKFIKKIRELGFLVKLDTNGTNPERLSKLVKEKLIDYIAMDIKAPLNKYHEIVDVEVDLDKIQKSVKIIMESGLPYEFRSTITPGLLNIDDISKMGEIIKGADKWFLQQFRSDAQLVDKNYEGKNSYTKSGLKEMKKIASQYVGKCEVR